MPISPSEVSKLKRDNIPDIVFKVFDELIIKNWNGRYATVKQDDVVDILKRRTRRTSDYYFDNHFLDVEDAYREKGWVVEYDKPGYCESYPATFKFSKKE